ncbi:MAG: 5'-deoxynucleotidase [Olsenella sp.]|nr:5'-deoxynucleotidase [Olsenella sp.]
MTECSSFFAIVSRMRYIERWALMRNSRPENLSEHSLEVAIIAHALATIGNVRHGRSLDAEKAALIGLFHDTTEIITGDMPTPVKYASGAIRDAYKDVEEGAGRQLLSELPEDLRPIYEKIYFADAEGKPDADEVYLRRLVKAADKISALIKCIEERQAGNAEFVTAEGTVREKVDEMASELPEVADYLHEFLPPYGNTLDQLL